MTQQNLLRFLETALFMFCGWHEELWSDGVCVCALLTNTHSHYNISAPTLHVWLCEITAYLQVECRQAGTGVSTNIKTMDR